MACDAFDEARPLIETGLTTSRCHSCTATDTPEPTASADTLYVNAERSDLKEVECSNFCVSADLLVAGPTSGLYSRVLEGRISVGLPASFIGPEGDVVKPMAPPEFSSPTAS